ncbi:MAG: PAS domain-containing protein, partial [Bacteroidota bacterium]
LEFFDELKNDISKCFDEGNVSFRSVSIRKSSNNFEHFSIQVNPIRKRGTNTISGACIRIKDTTKETNSIEILHKQKSLYETILDNIPAEIGIFDKDHRYQYVNPSGIKDKNLRQWIIGKTDYDYCAFRNIDKRIADKRKFLFNKVLETGKEYEIESFHHNSDGSTKFILRWFYPIYENGEFKMMIGYGIDITEIKKAQQNIQVNEERYRALFENNPLPVIVMDLNGIVISTNDAFCKDTGFPMTEIIGNNIMHLLSEKGKAAYPEWLTAYKNDPGVAYHNEIKILNANGRFADFEINLTRLNWDVNTPCVLVVANNITERKRNARLLEESERLNRRLLQELPVSVVTMVEGIITNVNQSFLNLIGVDINHVKEKPITHWMYEEDKHLFEKSNYDLFTGKETVETRLRFKRPNGEYRTVDLRESIFEMKKSLVTMAVINDVTDKVVAEEQKQEIEQRTKMIIESALDGIVLTDTKLNIVDWNSKSAEIFGLNDSDLSGSNLMDFFNTSDSQELMREGLFESVGKRMNNENFPTEIFTTRLKSEKKELLVFYIRDISERIAAANRIRESERIDNLLNQFNAEIYQLDDMKEVLNKMIATFHSICDFCHITVFQTDEDGQTPVKIEGVGESFKLPVWNETILIPSSTRDIVDQAQRSCSMIIRTGTDSGMEKSDLAVPININSKMWGVVRFETGFTGLFSEGNQQIIKRMLEATSVRLSKVF